jgi:adenylylsulfate kinase
MDNSGFTIWMTGMSGAGKSTLANYLAARLRSFGRKVELLDGDEIREVLSKGLGYSKEDRNTNIRRIAYVAKLLSRNGVVAITAAISPYREAREQARRDIGRFVEIFVDCPVEKLIERDTKGLYKKALAGELPNFTGITDPYEPPAAPEIVARTDQESVDDSAQKILQVCVNLGYLSVAEVKAMTGKKVKREPAKKGRRRAA